MSGTTTNYNLIKNESGDDTVVATVTNQNQTMNIIDAQMKTNENANSTTSSNLSNHVNGLSDRHLSSGIDDDSTVVGATQKDVNETLQSVDQAQQSQIDALVVGGIADPLGAVYKTKDLANTNDYIVSYGGLTLFDGLRLNVEVLNSNTGAVTLKLNSEITVPVRWRNSGVDQELEVSMMSGISELQYDAGSQVFLLLTRDGFKSSTDITQTTSIDQVSGATFKDSVVGGIAPKFDIEGDTVVNSVKNPNFENGTTDWSDANGILSESNEIASLTGDGANAIVSMFQDFDYNTGDVWFFTARARVTNSDAENLRMTVRTFGVDIVRDITNPIINQWYDLYGIRTISGDETSFRLYHSYADAGTANGKVMEVDFVTAINLTALNKQSYTAEEAFQRYGQKALANGINSSNGEIVVRGKNQFDFDDFDENKVNIGDVYEFYFKGVPNTQYTASSDIASSNPAGIYFGGGSTSVNGIWLNKSVTITSDGNGEIRFLVRFQAGTDAYTQLKNKEIFVQFELGDTATDYNPYTESRYAYDGKSVPNGVSDEINVLTGIGKKAISDVFTFDGTESWSSYINGQGVNNDLSRIRLTSFGDDNNLINVNDTPLDDYAIGHDGRGTYVARDLSSELTSFGIIVTSDLNIYIPTTDLPSDDLSGATSYLATNNLSLICQLATPVIEQLESEQFNLVKGGTIEDTSAVQSEKVYQVNLNTETRDNNTAKAIPRLENDLERGLDNVLTAKEDSGIVNEITLVTEREPKRLEVLTIVPNVTNTGACTITVNDNNSVALEKVDASGSDVALASGDLVANKPVQIMNRTDKYILIN